MAVPQPDQERQAADEQLTVPEDREAAETSSLPPRGGGGPPGPERGTVQPFELLDREQEDGYRARWSALQAAFVDDPKAAADQADALVGEVLEVLARRREELRDDLGKRFDEGADTEAMRLAIQHYRVFFERLSG